MAVEARRGCGYRKVGGLYLVGGGIGATCDRLPFELGVCPCCNAGFKPSLGWTWIRPGKFEKAGLIWIGGGFYKSPADFIKEGIEMGFSRRIKSIPRGFKAGETPVLLAHRKTIERPVTPEDVENNPKLRGELIANFPGIFYVWMPQAVEKIFTESERGSEAVEDAEKRGIRAVFVPDNDKDHQGTVYDKEDEDGN
jgi:hypothetical protein